MWYGHAAVSVTTLARGLPSGPGPGNLNVTYFKSDDSHCDCVPAYIRPNFFCLPLTLFCDAKSTQAMPSVLFFTFSPFVNSPWIDLVAPLALVEPDIRRFHSQGISIAKMVDLLRKHYDTDTYGIG